MSDLFVPTPDPQPTVTAAPVDLTAPQQTSGATSTTTSVSQLAAQMLVNAGNNSPITLGRRIAAPLTGEMPTGVPALTKKLPDNVKALESKWGDADVQAAIAQLPPAQRQALIDFDAERVAAGSTPLSKDDTIRAVQTLITETPATPAPDRNIWNVPGNLVGDLGTIVKSIPQLPAAALDTLMNLGQTGDEYDSALANLLSTPGINLIPGTYIAAQLARGTEGIQELMQHPLFTALDALPIAGKLAEGTGVVKAANEARVAAGETGKVRPLQTLASKTLNEAGDVVPNRLGEIGLAIRDETPIGRALDTAFGGRQRELAREQGRLQNRANATREGLVDDGTPESSLLRRSNDLRKKAVDAGWDAGKIATLKQIAAAEDLTPLSTLAPDELAYISEARDLATSYGSLLADRNELGRVVFGDGANARVEFYDTKTAGRYKSMTARKDSASRLVEARRRYLSDQRDLGPVDKTWVDDYTDWIAGQPKKQRGSHQQALDAYLAAHGYDVRAVKREAKAAGEAWAMNDRNPDTFPSLSKVLDTMTPDELMPLEELVGTLKTFRLPSGQVDPHAFALSRALASQDVVTIRRELDNLAGRVAKATPATDPRFAPTLRSLARRYGVDAGLGGEAVVKELNQAARALSDYTARHAPDRFQPLIQSKRDAKVTKKLTDEVAVGGQVTPEVAGRITDAVQNMQWDALDELGIDSKAFRRLHDKTTAEVTATWQQMVDEGIDPVFVHSVSTSRARAIDNPQITSVPNALTQTKARKIDVSQGIGDLGVALTHQGMEILTRNLRQELKTFVDTRYGLDEADLIAKFDARARELAATDSRLSYRGHLERLMGDGYVKLDQAFTGPGLSMSGEARFIPRSIARNLEPYTANPLTASMNRITGTFRVATTSLSIRNLLYNALGGATMTMAETGPGVWKFYGKARELMDDPAKILNDELRASLGGFGRDIQEQLAMRPDIQANVLGGRSLGRLVAESRAGQTVKKVSMKSVELNGWMDDMYRTMAYLYAEDKALTKGLSREASERAGLEMARKVMMDYHSLTPFERHVMRGVVPFYSFTSHVMRFVMRYPFDHPLRASITAAFGRSEAENQILPESFLSAFFFGSGKNQRKVDLSAANPLGGAADMFTIAGFLSATNPVIATVLEQAGLIQGQAELYPTLRYDPDTGRLSATRGNPFLSAVENVIPQSAILTALLGVNADFNERVQKDPAAASRILQSSAGLPIGLFDFLELKPGRPVNYVGEVAKAEAARFDSQQNALNDAVRSGQWNEALRYPGLLDDYQRMLDASPTELAQYIPQGQDIYSAMIEQALGRQKRQAQVNAGGGGDIPL
jgi:hypothetical protein